MLARKCKNKEEDLKLHLLVRTRDFVTLAYTAYQLGCIIHATLLLW
jgi:hypothetical protein